MLLLRGSCQLNKLSIITGLRKNTNTLGLALILMSGVLLGIWAVKNTIALRNIILFLGGPLSALYCYWQYQRICLNQNKISVKYFLPLVLVALMFAWVLFHYFFLSRYPEIQLSELRSTWLRTLFAAILGFGTGLALLRRPNAVNFLWIGIAFSFAYLFYQYIPKALATHSIFAPDYDGYIFYGKISGVLAGTLLIAGLLGTLLDRFSVLGGKARWVQVIFCLSAISIPLYSFVFIFDARNGVGLSLLMFGVVVAGLFVRLTINFFHKPSFQKILVNVLLLFCLVGIGGWFGWSQYKLNPGWASMFDDAKIAVQVDQYPNWQNPPELGYPKNASGKEVRGNTYERISWAVAGMTIFAPENPLGVGMLRRPFGVLLNEKYPNSSKGLMSTHSGWVELTLGFGYPALLMTLGALIIILWLTLLRLRKSNLDNPSPFHYLIALLAFTVIALYTVGEGSSQHAIEMLYFLIALMTGLLMPILTPSSPISDRQVEGRMSTS